MTSDLRDAEALIARGRGCLGRPLHILPTTTSTNDDAKRGAREGAPHGSCWVAEEQTAGRGRQGRTWIGTAGATLMFSVLLRSAAPPERVSLVSLVAGLAVRDAVAKAAGRSDIGLKWPNDVVGGGRKVAGILVESVVHGRNVDALIIGVGVNVSTEVFPDDLAHIATSIARLRREPSATVAGDDVGRAEVRERAPHDAAPLPPSDSITALAPLLRGREEVGEPTPAPAPLRSHDAPLLRSAVLADALAGIDAEVDHVLQRGLGRIHARIAMADCLRGRHVGQNTDQQGIAEGIDLEGRLLVRYDDGILHRWSSGEVHLTGSRG